MTSCPSELRFWCTPNNQGLPGVTLSELATLLTPLIGGGGKVAQVVTATLGSALASTNSIPVDDTIPQQTEGFEVLTATITPTNASSVLIIEAQTFAGNDSGNIFITGALFRDATADALAASSVQAPNTGFKGLAFKAIVSAGSVAATTFKLRVGNDGVAEVTINGAVGSRFFGGVAATTLTITEVAP